MVDLRKAFPLGSLSGRNILTFAATMLVAIFAFIFVSSPIAHAADASWQGSAISYANKQFIKTQDAGDNDPRGFAKGTIVYAYVEPLTSSPSNPTQKAHLIYFAPGTDPPTATSGTYVTYDYTPPNTYANPSGPASITIDAQAAAASGGAAAGTAGGTTSCALEGVGWIICPITNFLAGAMDWMFGILSGFLTVRPVQTSQDNALFRSWSVMRNFANVAFVIGFLIIIYSQITNIGISNYGIKRILPRLILAAILVNISYWICAVAIDLSNIAGNSLQELFISIRNSIVGDEGNSWTLMNWENIASFILSGGTAAVVAGIGANVLLGGTITGAIYMLVPILVIVLTSVLVALLVMALRQAFITILVIISPLAFVAYLLPNTEKYFDKWRDLFMTMLMMFPIFSVIFGGSQLAGAAIIQNANSINLLLLGMAIQVAPLIVTPLLLKFSGALLSRFAGVINNPNKGLIDRTRNWAKDRSENQKARVLGNPARPGWRGAASRRSQNIDAKRRKREGWRSANQALADARWANSSNHSDIQQASMRAGLAKEMGESAAQARFEASKTTNANMQQLDIGARAAKLRLDVSKATVDANWEELKAGDIRSTVVPAGLAQDGIANYLHTRNALARAVNTNHTNEQVEKRRGHNAEHEQTQGFANALLTSDALRRQAGGINPHGADSALASAVAATRDAYGKSIKDAQEVIKHFNLSGEQRQDLAMGRGPVTAYDSSGNGRTFTTHDLFAREAAIDSQMKIGTVKDAREIMDASGTTLYEFRTSIGEAVAESGLAAKTIYAGGQTIDLIKAGKVTSPARMMGIVQDTIAKGKFSADKLATIDKDAVKHVLDAAKMTHTNDMDPAYAPDFANAVQELKASAVYALNDKHLKGKIANNVKPLLERMMNEL